MTQDQRGSISADRLHVDAHPHAVARIVRQDHRLATAAVLIGHAIAVDPILEALLVANFATLHVIWARLGVHGAGVGVAPLAHVVTDRRTDDGTRHRCSAPTIAAADLVAERCANDAAEDHRASRRTRAAGLHFFIAGFVPALALRIGDTHVTHDGVDVDDAGIVVLGAVVVVVVVDALVGVAAIMGLAVPTIRQRSLPGEEQSG